MTVRLSGRSAWQQRHGASERAENQSCRLSSPPLYINRSTCQQREGSLIHPPRYVRVPQFASTTPTEFRSIILDPAPNRNVIYMHIPLCHDLLEIAQAQRISKIPSNAPDDDFGFEMSTLEQRWPVPSHERPSLSDSFRRFATLPSNFLCDVYQVKFQPSTPYRLRRSSGR